MSKLEVQSEIYNEKSTFRKVTTLRNSNSLVQLDFFKEPENDIKVDEDGDIVVSRNKRCKLEIEFSPSTTLSLVGLQIWRGALLLADFILSRPDVFKEKNVLELGSGVGLDGIIAGIYANEVLCSDIDKGGILSLIKKNINRNKNLIKGKINVTSLDFYQQEWSVYLNRKLQKTNIIIAADVIYDDSLTEAFVQCITKILQIPPDKKLYLALEKRYVFTVANLDSVAPCYEYLLKCIKNQWMKPPMCKWTMKEMKTDFKQYFDYDRTKELVLWEISV